jgi:hypothetical protein
MTSPRAVRYRCELHARLDLDAQNQVKGRVLELSEVGAFVEDGPGLEDSQVGDGGLLTLALPGGDPWTGRFEITRWGNTRRDVRDDRVDHVTVTAPGFGLEFVEIDDDELERLRDFLELLELR